VSQGRCGDGECGGVGAVANCALGASFILELQVV
jgi:hypothetical protein